MNNVKQNKMKIIITLILVGVVAVISLIGLKIYNDKPRFSDGTYKSNISDFLEPVSYNKESAIVDCYFSNVTYSVKTINEDKNTITLDVSIPDFASILKDTIDECMETNNNTDYETLLNQTKNRLSEKINDASHPTLNKEIELSIDKDEHGEWKIVPNDEFYNFITEPIINAMEE